MREKFFYSGILDQHFVGHVARKSSGLAGRSPRLIAQLVATVRDHARGSIVVAVFLIAAPAGQVDDSDGGRWSAGANGVREVRYDDGESIDGDRLSPSGERVLGGVSLRHRSLLTPREHFVDRLIHMAHDL